VSVSQITAFSIAGIALSEIEIHSTYCRKSLFPRWYTTATG